MVRKLIELPRNIPFYNSIPFKVLKLILDLFCLQKHKNQYLKNHL